MLLVNLAHAAGWMGDGIGLLMLFSANQLQHYLACVQLGNTALLYCARLAVCGSATASMACCTLCCSPFC